ncbi:MAG TPA: hypothetical protein VF247_07910 [Candidatus Krumholzibacteria bacterium]
MRKARVLGTAAAIIGTAVIASRMIAKRRSRNADGTFKSRGNQGSSASSRGPNYDRSSSRRSRRARRASR